MTTKKEEEVDQCAYIDCHCHGKPPEICYHGALYVIVRKERELRNRMEEMGDQGTEG